MQTDAPVFEAIERYKPLLTADQYQKLLEEALKPAEIAIRINRLKNINPQKTADKLSEAYGWQLRSLPYHDSSWQIISAQVPPGQTIEHRLGEYYVQDAASIVPVSLFSHSDKPLLKLDMAASPGGKTTQLIDLCEDKCFVLANDSSLSRMPALKTVLSNWGAANVAITNYSGEKLGDWFPEKFDRVLLDAPCSMEGLRVSPSHPFRPISASERQRLAQRQLALLISAVKAAKVGAEIVYSTCTLAPEENEMVLDTLLRSYPGIIKVDTGFSNKFNLAGIQEFEGISFREEVAGSARVWPFSFGTNGFFAVKLVKQVSIPSNQLAKPSRPFQTTGLRALNKDKTSLISNYLSTQFGFDLFSMLSINSLSLMERSNNVYLVPQTYSIYFSELPYYSLGMPAGKWFKDDFQISPEFIQRWGHTFAKGYVTLTKFEQTDWMKGLDIRGRTFDIPLGSQVLVRSESGQNLGSGKYLRGRLRNLLPNRNLAIG